MPSVLVGSDSAALAAKARKVAAGRKAITTSYAELVTVDMALTYLISREPEVAIVEDVPNAQYAMGFLMALAVTKTLTPAIVGRRCEPRPVPDFIFCVTTNVPLRGTVDATIVNVD